MSKKLSLEDKRNRLLQFFHEKKNVYLLKEVEKLASKEKGVPFQAIKDVLLSLVGDDLVDTEKIGTSTFFWSFPSKSYIKKSNECNLLSQTVNQLVEEEKNLDEEIANYTKNMVTKTDEGDGGEEYRNKIMQELMDLEREKQEILAKLDEFKDHDPDRMEMLKNQCQEARRAVDRWTDNVFAIKSWCKAKLAIDDAEIDKALGIPSNFDYYEES